jgi:hypothetical protein
MYSKEFLDYYRLFWYERDAAGNTYTDWELHRTDAAAELLKERAASYGVVPSISMFIRAFNELRAEGSLRQVRQPLPIEPEEPALTRDAYYKMPAATIIRRYRGEPEFRASVDRLIARGEI